MPTTRVQERASTHASAAPPPTVGDLMTANQRLEIGCCRCGRRELIEAPRAIELFGAFTTYPQLKRVAKCSKCGARGVDGDIWARASVEDHYRNHGVTATALQGETKSPKPT
ncbi:hypothetical protein [Caulobacter sp. RL271]|uniref:Uncharacterized protein n=1 Tax=Caulobacter segnis TaxID=88688 RepID=A0ABY4ZZ69_9CAUL|nr:hypothetical protein [Caulobacter segnis]USQ97221.1 hypothetical protein MZV50_06680 [Caulobacter segnis]